MRLTKFSSSPKIRSFLMGTIVFCVTFVISFSVFGGVVKLQRMEEAKKIALENKKYHAEKVKKAKAEEQVAPESTESIEAVEGLEAENPTSVGQEISEVSVSNLKEGETASVKLPEKTVSRQETIEMLVLKFQEVLDLSANEEWKSYPQDIRKEAFDIMNAKRQAQAAEVDKAEVVKKNDIDTIFQGETQNTPKWGDYVVLSGDTWNSIATKYSISAEDLQLMNSDIKRLFPGNKIIVPYKQ